MEITTIIIITTTTIIIRDRLEDQDVDGWTILKWILER
jgi:hypothetical protein